MTMLLVNSALFYPRDCVDQLKRKLWPLQGDANGRGKMRKLIVGIAEHPALTVGLCLLAGFALLNVLAYRHAWSMTHFIAANRRTRRTDKLRRDGAALSFVERMRLAVKGVALERPREEISPEDVGLAYEVHAYNGAEGRLAAWHIPQAHSIGRVVLFHGYLGCKARLLPETRALHELGYACFLVDFRGCGDSDGQRTSIGYHEADDVIRTAAYVREQWPNDPLILFGQSMGAAAVLRALSRRAVEADAVVLECPFDRALSTIQARFASTGLPSFPAAQLLVFWGGALHGYNGFDHNPAEYARRVTCPVLLLHGLADERVSSGQIQSIYRNLAGPKHLHFFEGVGHQSYAAIRADEWKTCIGRFLHERVLHAAAG
jgi:alpha-beta hydrolase superfamily lysophospholipase